MERLCLAASSALLILGLLLPACAPAAPPVPNPTPLAAVGPTPTASPTSTPRVVRAPTPTLTPTLGPTPKPAIPTPADKPRYGGILKVGGAGDLAHFDMHQETQTRFHAPLAPAYDLLVQMDPTDQSKVIADLAQSWEMSADGKVYTFRLAKEVKFHDGRPFTSADVKASFERIFWPPKSMISPRDSLFEAVSKVEAPDDYSIVFTLKYPQSSFLALLALGHNFIFPKHVLDKKGDMKKDIMGTGPFKFKEYVRGVSFETAKNPDYLVRERPFLDGIVTYIIPDAAARVAAFRSRNIHLIWPTENPLSSLEREALLKQTPTIVVQSVPGSTQNYLFPNHKRGPWKDARVRRAASLATDRQASVKVIWFGDATVGADFVPGSGWGLSSEELARTPGYREPKDADIAEAKRLLTEAGYPKGFKTTILTREESRYIRMAVFWKGELAKIGIDATVQSNETAIYNQTRNAGNFDTLTGGSGMLLADADAVLSGDYISNAGKNFGFYSNPKVDELTLKQRTSIDLEERKKTVREIQQILLEDVSRIVTDYQTMILISWPEVKNNRIGSTPFPFKKLDNVWLAQ